MENLENQQYRENLAQELAETHKDERPDVLDKAKESAEYWQARNEKINEREDEEPLDDGLGVLIKHKTLYHGSGLKGIDHLNEAEETTVGSGVYFTSQAKDAIGYARRRAKNRKGEPTIYEASVENIRLLNLKKDENVKTILTSFKDKLKEELKKPRLPWYWEEALKGVIKLIEEDKVHSGNLREVSSSAGKLFTEHAKSLGYNGLVCLEGGEGDEVGEHDSYVIFDPEKAKIIQEHNVV